MIGHTRCCKCSPFSCEEIVEVHEGVDPRVQKGAETAMSAAHKSMIKNKFIYNRKL
jgi:hypothetical protein